MVRVFEKQKKESCDTYRDTGTNDTIYCDTIGIGNYSAVVNRFILIFMVDLCSSQGGEAG